jgi:putative intracellular protease/amidase
MAFYLDRLKLHHPESFPNLLRVVNRSISEGNMVYRWQGPPTPLAAPGDLFHASGASDEILAPTESMELPESELSHLLPVKPGRVALLWDKSFLWGFLAVCTLRDLGFSFDLLTVKDVRAGALASYQLLVVPGGWASLRSKELGGGGREELLRYVYKGGAYLGICGGAGLALQVDEGLALVPVTRKPITDRLPNFSGSIRVRQANSHPFWWGLPREEVFHVWWPSQFHIVEPDNILVLGQYGQPESDFCVSDLKVCEALAAGTDWGQFEETYQINLDPKLIIDEPAVLEGRYGEGRVFLSYPHLETPGDAAGNTALFNIWYDLLNNSALGAGGDSHKVNPLTIREVDGKSLERMKIIAREALGLVALGERHNLWSWRNSWLLQWRRGVRGAEFGTISVLLNGLVDELERTGAVAIVSDTSRMMEMDEQCDRLEELWNQFHHKGRALLEEEGRQLTGEDGINTGELAPSLRNLRSEIFNCVQCYGSKSYGGLYRQLLDHIDSLLLGALLLRSN